MCVVCVLEKYGPMIATKSSVQKVLEDWFKVMTDRAILTPSPEAREFVANQCELAAHHIREFERSSIVVNDAHAVTVEEFELRKGKVEKSLLKREGEFYQQFGMVMPDEVRSAIRADLWDNLEEGEYANIGT